MLVNGQSLEHKSAHANADVGLGVICAFLIVAGQAAELVKSSENMLDSPSEAGGRGRQLTCSPKVEPGAIRVGGAQAPPNSPHETQTTYTRRNHQEATRGRDVFGRRPKRRGGLQEAGSQPADISPLEGGDGQTATGTGEGKRAAQADRGGDGSGQRNAQGTRGGGRAERDSQRAEPLPAGQHRRVLATW